MCGHQVLAIAKDASFRAGIGRWIASRVCAALSHRLVILLAAIALFRGLIYLIVLPSWDLNDEEQHFHYVQYLTMQRQIPLMASTYLSSEIVASVSDTLRWEHFHLHRPEIADVQHMGLEGFSYEAYQPPAYYALLTLPYSLLLFFSRSGASAGSSLDGTAIELYGLRLFSVGLSTVTVLLAYLLFRRILGGSSKIAAAGACILMLLPERTMATSRVNNDVLLELLSTLSLLVLVISSRRLIAPREALLLGTLASLSILTKLSAIILVPLVLFVIGQQALNTRSLRYIASRSFIVISAVAVITGWFFVRNALLYGDITGVNAFLVLANFTPRFTPVSAVLELGRGLWMTRWIGVVPDILAIFMAVIGLLALVGLGIYLIRARQSNGCETGAAPIDVLVLLSGAALWLIPLWWGVRTGLIQHIDGRFLLPAYTPIVGLLLLGLSQILPSSAYRMALFGIALVLAVADAAYLTVFSLPHYYFRESHDLAQVFAHKPGFINELSSAIVVFGYIAGAVILCLELRRPEMSQT